MEKMHGILSLHKKVIQNIIRKIFFICEPFITVTDNTNSYVTKDCLYASTQAQRSGNGKNSWNYGIQVKIPFIKKVRKNIIRKVFFICDQL